MSSTKIHVMKFAPPISYNDTLHKIILANQIKEDNGWIIQYKNINYIIGNVWNTLTHCFDPGPGANIIVPGIITQDDIDTVNNAHRKDNTSGLIFLIGHNYKYNYNNNNWYGDHIENTINFDRFTIPESLSNTRNMNDTKSKKLALQQTHSQRPYQKYIPPPLRSNLLYPTDDKIWNKIAQNHTQKQFETEIAIDNASIKLLSKPTHPNRTNNNYQTISISTANPKIISISKAHIYNESITAPSQQTRPKNDDTSTKITLQQTHPTFGRTLSINPNNVKSIHTSIDELDSGALSTSKALPDDTANSKNITYKHNKLSLEVNDESLAQNRTYKEINSSLEKHKTSHSNDVSDSTCTKTHSGITTTSSTQNENPNTSIAKAEKIPNDNNNIDNIDANNNTPKPIPNGSNNINDIDENDNTKFTYTAKTGKILYDAISTPKTIPNDNNINDKAENNNIKCDATSQKAISNDNNNVDDKDINNNKKCTELSSPKEILNEDEENKIKYSTLSTPKEIHDNGDANKNINIIPTSPNANIANMRAISGKKWNNQYTKEKLIETSGKTLKLTATLDKKLIETLNSDAISPPKTISNGNILYTLDTG